jgi:hypothetical protein
VTNQFPCFNSYSTTYTEHKDLGRPSHITHPAGPDPPFLESGGEVPPSHAEARYADTLGSMMNELIAFSLRAVLSVSIIGRLQFVF